MPGVPPSGLRTTLATAVAALGLAAGTAAPAGALPLDPTDEPLDGSTFQAADGNQEPTATLSDWAEAAEMPGRVVHTSDPNDQDSAFGPGSKEEEPITWDIVRQEGGVTPAKDNIRDAWTSTDRPADETFAYLAFAREEAGGTASVTFELNRARRLWNNGEALVPCRMDGDVQISYEGGKDVNVVVRRWVTTETDPGSGCAARGRLDEAARLQADIDVQGAMNPGRIDNALPGAGGDEYEERYLFGEAGINLDRVLASAFGEECFAFSSFWMHSRASDSVTAAMKDYVAPRRLIARKCAASGVKFFDLNADGTRDPGEPGIPRFEIFADYDGDGKRDAGEPFTVTGVLGRYVLDDIRPPDGTYMLRESLLPDIPVGSWTCSYPNADTPLGTTGLPGPFPCGWGPINAVEEPHARSRGFGNWYPARLTLRKELFPSDDPARFDLLVNGDVVLEDAGDGATVTLELPPGTYTPSESGSADGLVSTVDCRRDSLPATPRAGVSAEPIPLQAGDVAECVFRNRRPGAAAIAIDKSGPAEAEIGATLEYRIDVTNIGAVAFPATGVDVADPRCDAPPELVAKRDASGPDGSPETLDPGDTWTYRCSHATARRGDGCQPLTVRNTATVTGTVGETTVEERSWIDTQLRCVIPTPPPDGGDGTISGSALPAVPPPGPLPPTAGAAGRVRLSQLPRCFRRGSRVTIRGSKIARVRLSSGGVRIRGVRVRPLARKVVIRVVRNFAPGRYRVTARVSFERGAGTPPVSLTRRVRVCGAPAPAFTG